MALEFKKGLEAIDFGGLVVEPQLDVEKRLRLQNIKLDDLASMKEGIKVIASCFGDKSEEVAEFISQYMGIADIARLQVYLVGGDDMLQKVDKKIEGIADVKES